MAWNGLGTYVLSPTYSPEVNGTTIDASRYNGLTTDIAQGISNAVAKDGQNAALANLPMGGFKHTGALAATVGGEYLTWGQSATLNALTLTSLAVTSLTVTNLTLGAVNFAAATGLVNVYAITLSPVPGAYAAGQAYAFTTTLANTTTTPTLNVNALGAITLTNKDGSALVAGQIPANSVVSVVYNSTGPRFELINNNTVGVTQSLADNSTKTASTAWVLGQAYAALAGPTFTGTVAVTGAAPAFGVATTQVATTAFVDRLRDLNISATSGTAVLADRGTLNLLAAGITIPAAVFSAGHILSYYNNTAAALSITQGAGLTMRLAGSATTGTRTLALRGTATVVFISASECAVSGAGVT